MKILSVTLAILIAFAIIFWGLFYYSIRLARETITAPQATTAASSSAKSFPKINLSTGTPLNSGGPSGPPHITGPSGPPPTY